MTLIVRSLTAPPAARLRQLIVEALPELFGESARSLPPAGQAPAETLTAVDANNRLWVIGYSSTDPGRALLNGLAALREARALLPWLRQARLVPQATGDCQLLILTPTLPAGAAELCRLTPVQWRCMRFLEVNGEPAIWFEPALAQPRAAAPTRATPAVDKGQAPEVQTLKREEAPLSPEEEAFFQHL